MDPAQASENLGQFAPNFMVIGGARCGTTWLHKMLCTHPDVFLPEVKEPDYFNRCLVRQPYRQFLSETYRHSPVRPFRGDMSVNYSMMPRDVVRCLKDILPELRLVMVLRNPVDRSWSQIKLNRDIMADVWKKHPFLGRGKRKPAQELSESEIYRDLVHPRIHRRTDYLWTMENWESVYGADAMHVELFESVSNEPCEMIARVLRHFGASTEHWECPDEVRERVLGSNAELEVPPFARYWLSKEWIEPTQRLNEKLGGILGHWIESMQKDIRDLKPWSPSLSGAARAFCSHRIYDCYELLRWNAVKHKMKKIANGDW